MLHTRPAGLNRLAPFSPRRRRCRRRALSGVELAPWRRRSARLRHGAAPRRPGCRDAGARVPRAGLRESARQRQPRQVEVRRRPIARRAAGEHRQGMPRPRSVADRARAAVSLRGSWLSAVTTSLSGTFRPGSRCTRFRFWRSISRVSSTAFCWARIPATSIARPRLAGQRQIGRVEWIALNVDQRGRSSIRRRMPPNRSSA